MYLTKRVILMTNQNSIQKTIIYGIGDLGTLGYYAIEPACNAAHMFTIPSMSSVKINIVNAEPNTQDMSMRGWFSDSPMGQMLFTLDDARLIPFNIPKMYSFDNINIPTPGLMVEIFDKNNPQFANENLKLDASKTYYVCVENMQNKKNAYRLMFSTSEYSTNYDDQTKNGSGFSCNDDVNSDNCNCECHTKKKGRPRKDHCPSCGHLPSLFIR